MAKNNAKIYQRRVNPFQIDMLNTARPIFKTDFLSICKFFVFRIKYFKMCKHVNVKCFGRTE